jgi:hypothetical protein
MGTSRYVLWVMSQSRVVRRVGGVWLLLGCWGVAFAAGVEQGVGVTGHDRGLCCG